MKKFLLIVGLALVLGASVVSAQTLQYTPLEPLSRDVATYPNIGSYLNTAFSALLTLGALFAVVTFTIGGVVYMTSDAMGKKSSAVERMKASLWGLLLLAASVLILNTINPGLLNFDLSSIGQRFGSLNASPGSTSNTPIDYFCIGGSNAGTGRFLPGSTESQSFTSRCEAGGGRVSLNPPPSVSTPY